MADGLASGFRIRAFLDWRCANVGAAKSMTAYLFLIFLAGNGFFGVYWLHLQKKKYDKGE